MHGLAVIHVHYTSSHVAFIGPATESHQHHTFKKQNDTCLALKHKFYPLSRIEVFPMFVVRTENILCCITFFLVFVLRNCCFMCCFVFTCVSSSLKLLFCFPVLFSFQFLHFLVCCLPFFHFLYFSLREVWTGFSACLCLGCTSGQTTVTESDGFFFVHRQVRPNG